MIYDERDLERAVAAVLLVLAQECRDIHDQDGAAWLAELAMEPAPLLARAAIHSRAAAQRWAP